MKNTLSIVMPNLNVGGAERVAVNLANEFVRRGYGVDMVLLETKGPLIFNLTSTIRVIHLKQKFNFVMDG